MYYILEKFLNMLIVILCILFVGLVIRDYYKNKNNTIKKQTYIDSGIDAPLRHKYVEKKNIKKTVSKKIVKQVVEKDIIDSEEIIVIAPAPIDKIEKIKAKRKLLNGYAEYTWENGDKYVGYWKDGYMEGGGVYIFAEDGVKCIDNFKHGFPIHDIFEYGEKTYRIKK